MIPVEQTQDILVSVIIPTFDRANVLADLLDSLCSQTLDPSSFEVIVVDNCSRDHTAELVRQRAQEGPIQLMNYECADIDLAWRDKKNGYGSRFVPESVVFHEVWRVSPWNWLHKRTQMMLPMPLFLKRHPDLSRQFLWFEPFCFRQNLLFYLFLLAIILWATVSRWFLLFTLPYFDSLLRSLGFRSVIRKPLRSAAQIVFLAMGQAVTCLSLIYGSVRARRIVL